MDYSQFEQEKYRQYLAQQNGQYFYQEPRLYDSGSLGSPLLSDIVTSSGDAHSDMHKINVFGNELFQQDIPNLHADHLHMQMDTDDTRMEEDPQFMEENVFQNPGTPTIKPNATPKGILQKEGGFDTPVFPGQSIDSSNSVAFRQPVSFTNLTNDSSLNLSEPRNSFTDTNSVHSGRSSPVMKPTNISSSNLAPTSANASPSANKPESPFRRSNYYYFNRQPNLFNKVTQDKAAAVKLRLEHYYQMSVSHAIERNQRKM